jgi:hypothetical protein
MLFRSINIFAGNNGEFQIGLYFKQDDREVSMKRVNIKLKRIKIPDYNNEEKILPSFYKI